MTRGKRGAPFARGRAAAIAASLLAPVVGYLVIKTAASAMSPAMAVAASALPPSDPGPLLKGLVRSVQDPRVKVRPEVLEAARKSLAEAPLSYEPFYIAARAEDQAGRRRVATALMEEARLRRPTFLPIRMQLMAYYAEAERYPQALQEMDLILRRNTEARKAIIPELLKLLKSAEGREALADMLATSPEWRPDFLSAAGGKAVEPADAAALYALIRAKKPRGDLRLEQQMVLQSRIAAGDFRGARASWLETLPPAERQRNAVLFDGSFRDLDALLPFSWKFADSDTGRAEPAKGEGRTYLDVSYFGGRDIVLAEQVLGLAPGKYRLGFVARSDARSDGARLYWRVRCVMTEIEIGRIDLTRVGTSFGRVGGDFTVPAANCPGQSLALVAEAGEVASTVNMQITGMELTR